MVPGYDEGIQVDGSSYASGTSTAWESKIPTSSSRSTLGSTYQDYSNTSPTLTKRSRLPSTSTIQFQSTLSTPITPTIPSHSIQPVPGVLRFLDPTTVNLSGIPEFEGPGWIATKVVTMGGGGVDQGRPGIYSTSLWEFEIFDTPSGEGATKTKDLPYRPMGDWLVESPKINGSGEKEVEVGGTRSRSSTLELLDDVTMDSINDVLVQPLSSNSTSTTPKKIPKHSRTPTREELDLIRPHPNAYFSRTENSWMVFAPAPIPTTFIDNSHVELWRTVQNSLVKASELGIQPPPEPASPDLLDSEFNVEEWSANRPSLMKLVSTKGKEVYYSRIDYYPAVIPKDLWEEFVKLRQSQPTPGQSETQALFDSVYTIWR